MVVSGLVGVLDADKYLRRGSLWEAHRSLEEARTAVWRLSATAQGLPFPEYGLTTLLDASDRRLPADVDATATSIDAADLRIAVERCAALLEAQSIRSADAGMGGTGVRPQLALWARDRLGMMNTA